MRLDHAKRLNITAKRLLDEKIQLYKMTEEVLWADLDRYLHEDVSYLTLYLILSINFKGGILKTPNIPRLPIMTCTRDSALSGPWWLLWASSSFTPWQ